jgi:thiamine monophosphate synthase
MADKPNRVFYHRARSALAQARQAGLNYVPTIKAKLNCPVRRIGGLPMNYIPTLWRTSRTVKAVSQKLIRLSRPPLAEAETTFRRPYCTPVLA